MEFHKSLEEFEECSVEEWYENNKFINGWLIIFGNIDYFWWTCSNDKYELTFSKLAEESSGFQTYRIRLYFRGEYIYTAVVINLTSSLLDMLLKVSLEKPFDPDKIRYPGKKNF